MQRGTGEPESDNLLVAKPQSHSYISSYLGKKTVPQKIPTGLLAGRHRWGICSHSLSLWKAEARLWGIRAPWDCVLLFVWFPCGVLCFETPERAAAMGPLFSRCAVGSRVRKTLYGRLPWGNGPSQEGTFVPIFRSSAQTEGRRKGGKGGSPALPTPVAPSCPEAQQSQALASLSWSSKVEIHNWETSVPKTASERPHSPILLESTEPQCWYHRLFSYLSSIRFLLEGPLCLHGMDRDKCWVLNNEKLPQATVQVLKRERLPSPRLKVQGECRRENP